MATIFERATRKKLRFKTSKGALSVEDIWDLPLTGATSLDNLAKNINKKVKTAEEESFVEEVQPSDEKIEATLQLEIVKHVISIKLKDKKAAEKAAETRAKKARVMAILAEKQDEDLKNASKEELEKLLAELGE